MHRKSSSFDDHASLTDQCRLVSNVYAAVLDATPIMLNALRVTSSQDKQGTRVGVPRESRDGERRVALVPQMVEKLAGRGLQVVVEPGAGVGALMPDEMLIEAGATIGDPWDADVVVKLDPPTRRSAGCVAGRR